MSTYEPELLAIFQKIFDEIWQQLETQVPLDGRDDRQSELARSIVLAHRRGLKPNAIKEEVLAKMKF